MNAELVKVVTADGLELDGFLSRPATTNTAVLHIHGSAGFFYENYFIREIAKGLYNNRIAYLTVNTTVQMKSVR